MCRRVVMRELMWVWMSVDCASCMCINCASRCSTTNSQQLFAVKLAEASESVMPTSSLVLLQLRCKRRRHLQRQGEAIGLWWRLGLNVLATAQRIATELASTRPAAVATSTAGIAPTRQVFCLLAWRFVLLTGEQSSATLCSGQVRRASRHEAIMAYASLCLEGPSLIRQMITGAAQMTRTNMWANMWAHLDRKQRQQVKADALQEYQAKADKNVLEFFFDTWQAFWAKLFDAKVCSEPCYTAGSASSSNRCWQFPCICARAYRHYYRTCLTRICADSR